MSPDTTQLADGIAVIGMAGKFPGAPNLAAYWENLEKGVSSITHFTEAELEVPASISSNPQYVRARAIVKDVDLFDADFFAMNPREANYTDPQHRLLLETAWEALENAGYDSERYPGSIGVFAGCSLNSYLLSNILTHPGFLPEYLAGLQIGAHPALLGNDKDFLATRIAYKLNLRGPCVAVQSACSTSLVAICQAAQNLLNFQCDIALAGGVSVTFPQKRGYAHEEGSIVSSDGACRPYDADADGTIFGDGVGLVVLKRADEAIRDGDHIHAVIRGFAVNNDGSAKVSYMAPSVDGQADAIATAQALAGIDPLSIRYIEGHGTGTPLGDPIEVAGLTKAFRTATSEKQFCALGGVKGNIGHLEAAAGVAGMIKAILVLQNGKIPPTVNFKKPNPRIDFASSPFYVSSELKPWPASDVPRRAGVSSFGVGGTNAHVVLEEAPAVAPSEDAQPRLFVLSAKSPAALDEATKRLANHIQAHNQLSSADIAYTLQVGRRAFRYRRSCVARTKEEAVQLLSETKSARIFSADTQGVKGGVAFLFPGQGAQQVDMGRELYDTHPVFRAQVDVCCEKLAPDLGLDLREVLYPAEAEKAAARDRLMQTSLTQPALFVIEYAHAQVWMSLGVKPQVMIGHSLGEFVAATLAGIFSLEDALHLIAVRGRIMQSLPAGSMLAVVSPEEEVAPLIGEGLSLAAVNGPKLCVVSGPDEAVEALRKKLSDDGKASKPLKTSHAFHSAMMDPILAEFEAEVARVSRNEPEIPIVSSLYGRVAASNEMTLPGYWSAQLRRTVRFADAIAQLMEQPDLALLEVGPGQTLTTFARQNPAKKPNQATIHCSPKAAGESDTDEFLSAAGRLWLAGVDIDWVALHGESPRSRVPVPTYPFERKSHWVEPYKPALGFEEPASAEAAAPPSDLEAVIEQQLRTMEKQIEALQKTVVASVPHPGGPA